MIAVIRIRGTVNVKYKITDTLEKLRLFKPNHLVLVSEENALKKMVEKVKDYVTFGEINEETFAALLEKRGRLKEGENKKLSKEFLKENKFSDFKALAKGILEGKVTLKKLGMKPIFRLHPPRKGHARAGIKKPFTVGGVLGYRASEINKLVRSMM